jgi:hypothetical protein
MLACLLGEQNGEVDIEFLQKNVFWALVLGWSA